MRQPNDPLILLWSEGFPLSKVRVFIIVLDRRILIFVPEVVCVLFNHLIVLYFLLSMTLHSTLFGKLIQKRGKKNMCEAPNLKFIIDMLAIINKMQLPIFSLFNVFLSAISGPLFFFLSYATLVPVVLLIVIDSTFIFFFNFILYLNFTKLY